MRIIYIHHKHKNFFCMEHKTSPKILLHALFKQVRRSLNLNRVFILLFKIPATWLVPGWGILVSLVCWCTLAAHLL